MHTDLMADLDPTTLHGPTLSLSEATSRCSVSRATIQRRLKAGDLVGAYRTNSGGWSIPISSLIGAGLIPRTTPPDDTSESEETTEPVLDQSLEIAVLKVELHAARQLAEERAERISDLKAALDAMGRALNSGPTQQVTDTPEPALVLGSEITKPRWLRRFRATR